MSKFITVINKDGDEMLINSAAIKGVLPFPPSERARLILEDGQQNELFPGWHCHDTIGMLLRTSYEEVKAQLLESD